ncbi:MAG: histidine phosphatase family protein [Chloroflexota bacterium]|nr:histidine phosphatase family protein [Chloroflexota bacterium]
MSSTLQTQPATLLTSPGPGETLACLVRHAQTEWNRERRFQGQLDVPLDAEGVEQSKHLAEWLSEQPVHFTALYASDLARARHTAETIGERLGLSPRLVPALREIDAGEWQGLLTTQIEDLYPGQMARWHREANYFRLPGGETIPEVRSRVLAWYAEAIKAHRGEAIVVVSHGLAIRSLMSALEGWDVSDTQRMRMASMGNTGVTALLADHASNRSSVLFYNSLSHLEPITPPGSHVEGTVEPPVV